MEGLTGRDLRPDRDRHRARRLRVRHSRRAAGVEGEVLNPDDINSSIERAPADAIAARQPKSGESDAQRRERVRAADDAFATRSEALSRMLFAPVAGQLEGDGGAWKGKRLVIVAPGATSPTTVPSSNTM